MSTTYAPPVSTSAGTRPLSGAARFQWTMGGILAMMAVL